MPSKSVRGACAALLLAFCLNAFAHAAHTHSESLAANMHAAACGYCIAFDHLAPAAAPSAIASIVQVAASPTIAFVSATSPKPRFALASPRGPPGS